MLLYVIKYLVLLYVLETICMDELNRILVLFLHLECMDHFLINVKSWYKCVIQVWGVNNVMTIQDKNENR